ncbi:Acylphosphatase [compost metagenome]
MLVRVSGRVQGVSFRIWTRREAERLGVAGWVRNERDGSVAAMIVGSDAALANMIERLWIGPAAASVVSVETEPVALSEPVQGFQITG